MKQNKALIIIGSGGHAISVANVAISAGFRIHKFVDKAKKGKKLLGIDIVASIKGIDDNLSYSYAIAIGDNCSRFEVFDNLLAHGPLHFPVLAHSSAVISEYSTVGSGSVLMPNSVIGPNSKVERFCLVNTGASIDHDCVMREFSSLAPGVVTGGEVEIGERSAILIGARLKHRVKIGKNSVVGANSFVKDNVLDNTLVFGTPAKVIRTRKTGDQYL